MFIICILYQLIACARRLGRRICFRQIARLEVSCIIRLRLFLLWNELTNAWNETTFLWNETTMERNDRNSPSRYKSVTSENIQLRSSFACFFVSHLYQTSNVFINNTDCLTFVTPGILHFTHVFKGLTLL